MTMTIYYSNKVFNKPQSEMPLDTPPVLFLERLPARGICGVSRNLRSTGSKPPGSIKIHQVLSLKGKNELNSLTTSRPGKDAVLQFCSSFAPKWQQHAAHHGSSWHLVFILPIHTAKPSMHRHGQIFIGLHGRHWLAIHFLCGAISGVEVMPHGMLIGLVVHAHAAGRQRTIPAKIRALGQISGLRMKDLQVFCNYLKYMKIQLVSFPLKSATFQNQSFNLSTQALNGMQEFLHQSHLALILINSGGWKEG